MLNLNDLALFAATVEAGSLAAAARRLGIPKSTVSKRVAALEAAVDARLLQRGPRSCVPTDAGRAVFAHARAALIEAEAAEAVILSRRAEPAGVVRVTASVPTAQEVLAPVLPRLALALPKVRLEIDVTDRFVDILQEGVDIAVRSHFAPLPDSSLVQRQVSVQPCVLVASPAYLAARGAPAVPGDLALHDGLPTDGARPAWTLRRDHAVEHVAAVPRLVANETQVLLAAAAAGLGIACLPQRLCDAALRDGRLVRVLDGWTAGEVATSLLMPHRRGQLPAVRAVVDCIVDAHRDDDVAGAGRRSAS